jgi:DNA-directed RNA polymerase specialized sigma24 family protein
LPLPADAAEAMAAKLYTWVERLLSARITPKFGLPTAEELVSDRIAALLEAIEDPARTLPAFVVDTQTLSVWAFRCAWSAFCQKVRRRGSGPAVHGLSGAGGRLPDGSCDPLGMQSLPDDRYDGELEQAGLEIREAVELGLDDLRRWKGDVWVATFVQVCLEGRPRAEVAGELGIHPGNVLRRLRPAQFCIARRLGYDLAQLIADFGESEARRWTADVEAALRRPR